MTLESNLQPFQVNQRGKKYILNIESKSPNILDRLHQNFYSTSNLTFIRCNYPNRPLCKEITQYFTLSLLISGRAVLQQNHVELHLFANLLRTNRA